MPTDKSIDSLLKSKKRFSYRDYERRRRNLRWTFILSPIYIILTCLFIFYGHKMDGLQAIVFLLCLGIPTTVSMMWVGTTAKTKWKEFIKWLKALLIAVPFFYFPMNGPPMYKEYQLEKYKTLTSGVVTNTFSKYFARGGTTSYWADVNYYYDGQVISGQCGMKPDQYIVGDSVIIIYSSDIPEFYALAGKKKLNGH